MNKESQSQSSKESVGVKEFRAAGYGTIQATEIRLNILDAKPGTMGWLDRFSIITTGETAKKWPSINARYIDGIVDSEGNWIADFKEPIENNPTKF